MVTEDLAATRGFLIRLQRRALAAGGLALVAVVAGAIFNLDQGLRSWLVAWLFWLGLALGSVALLLLHHVTGGAWGMPIRRLLEAAMRTMPLLALLFVPLLLGVRRLYPWAASDAALGTGNDHLRLYLALPFFRGRAFLYFALWIGLALLVDRRSRRRDADPGPATERRLRAIAAPGLLIYGLTMTFASIDWAMSLEPHWRSTIYGVIFIVGQLLAALAFVLLAAATLRAWQPFGATLTPRHFQDLGGLTLAFVLLWSYVAYSQYLIIWSANLPSEAGWYTRRLGHGWQALALVLLLGHFLVPLLVLLSRRARQNAKLLAVVAAGLLCMRLADLHWLITPAFGTGGRLHWLDLATPLAVGGLWLAGWIEQLKRRSLLPPIPAPQAPSASSAPPAPPAPPATIGAP